LVRVSQGIHKDLQIRTGDVIILSSRFIPGNERNITKMIDELYRAGAEVLYESVHQIHVSGHGFQEELLLMLNATRPKHFVPIHGEYRHLKKHATLAKRAGVKDENIHVIEDGQILEVDQSGAELGERLELRKMPLVSGEEIQVDEDGFADRLALAKTGVIVTALARDRKTGDLLCDPQIVAKGVLFRESSDAQTCLNEASEALETLFEKKGDSEDFDELTRLEMRRHFKHHATHKPQVISVTLDV
jgi:ribonuclease J